VQTQLSVGGNLAEIFDNIAEMIRERVRLLGELAAATAEGRLSAGILTGMPFVMAFLVHLISPGYLRPLFHEKLGLILVGVAVVLMSLGALVMRKLIDIDV
jgi:tight adherence protein B